MTYTYDRRFAAAKKIELTDAQKKLMKEMLSLHADLLDADDAGDKDTVRLLEQKQNKQSDKASDLDLWAVLGVKPKDMAGLMEANKKVR